MTLYCGVDDLGGHRVRLLLAEKELVDVHTVLLRDGQRDEDLLILNPAHTLPTLIHRGLALSDIRILIEYLEERFPMPSLLSGDPVERAQQRAMLAEIENELYAPALAIERGDRRARRVLRERLARLASARQASRWWNGRAYSAVDAFLAPLLWRLTAWGLEAAAAPLGDYAQRLFARDAFAASLTDSESTLR